MPDDFDASYRQTTHVYGAAPDPLLTAHQQQIAMGRPVLDLGSGQGRHALSLARVGHEVHALDPSAVAVAILSELATQEGLPIRCLQCHFQEFPGKPASYGAVLVFGLIPILTWDDIATLRAALGCWLAPGGLAFLTAFTTADDTHAGYAARWQPAGPNSYTDGAGGVRTYLEPGELPTLFPDLEPIHTWEGLGPWHRHGEGPEERHALAHALLRQPGPNHDSFG
jgi:SAM-dependent methyltransferase